MAFRSVPKCPKSVSLNGLVGIITRHFTQNSISQRVNCIKFTQARPILSVTEIFFNAAKCLHSL